MSNMRDTNFILSRAAIRGLVVKIGLEHEQASNAVDYFASAIGVSVEHLRKILIQYEQDSVCENKDALAAVRREMMKRLYQHGNDNV